MRTPAARLPRVAVTASNAVIVHEGRQVLVEIQRAILDVQSGAAHMRLHTTDGQCAGSGLLPNDSTNPAATAPFLPFLGCNDLTRPTPDAADGCAGASSTLFPFRQSKDIKLFSAYVQDQITWHSLGINLGLRNDYYDGFVTHDEVQPRLGVSYNIKRTNTVLRLATVLGPPAG